jgi:hypothetical protein
MRSGKAVKAVADAYVNRRGFESCLITYVDYLLICYVRAEKL